MYHEGEGTHKVMSTRDAEAVDFSAASAASTSASASQEFS